MSITCVGRGLLCAVPVVVPLINLFSVLTTLVSWLLKWFLRKQCRLLMANGWVITDRMICPSCLSTYLYAVANNVITVCWQHILYRWLGGDVLQRDGVQHCSRLGSEDWWLGGNTRAFSTAGWRSAPRPGRLSPVYKGRLSPVLRVDFHLFIQVEFYLFIQVDFYLLIQVVFHLFIQHAAADGDYGSSSNVYTGRLSPVYTGEPCPC